MIEKIKKYLQLLKNYGISNICELLVFRCTKLEINGYGQPFLREVVRTSKYQEVQNERYYQTD